MRLRSERASVPRNLCCATLVFLALTFSACSLLHRGKTGASSTPAESSAQSSAEATPSAESTPAEGTPSDKGAPETGPADNSSATDTNAPSPGATVAISYAHKGDYLASLSVSKFDGAEMVETRNLDAQHVASIIRFDGGATVWEINADTGVFSKLPVLGSGDKFAAKSVTYGKLPEYFAQTVPDSGSPEPLETGHYYIFAAQRASGAMSYEAVRVQDDGSLDGYEAEPRAGTSYVLCCNVSPDFVQPAPPVVPEGSGSSP